MENTQGVWILCVIVLTLNILIADKQMIAAKRHCIVKAARLNQSIHVKIVLTSKCKSKNVLYWGKDYTFISIGNERLWIYSRLVEIRFGPGRPHECLGYRHGEKSTKDYRASDF